ncbi:hypothetical protein DLE60_21870 [Micromonospora globispora]|uniref:Uncharacterized protein n=1 Tax=Micromonospora globispora TaxID=1450148 RepID=A0A317K140_9ACTN|nr:hypothetical protein [Micromonospora globispora]PWU46787.1 hypothetical protein DLJ46_16885 [Micromonospora globispora]PWU58416.1 hypothetical protein DLE60_21870 [Micromonospora globispora]RQW96044.1 hypothetical protein DKL51_13955 [Micromonospora globispora]
MLSWLSTRWGKVAYFVSLVICAGLGGLLFGFGHGIVLGAAALNLALGVVAAVGLIRTIRKGPSAADEGSDSEPDVTEPDWLSMGEIEVRVTGRRRRYLARFATVAPAVDEMSREERRIAATLRFLGMPEATVVKLDKEANEGGTREAPGRQIVEIPELAIRDAARFPGLGSNR